MIPRIPISHVTANITRMKKADTPKDARCRSLDRPEVRLVTSVLHPTVVLYRVGLLVDPYDGPIPETEVRDAAADGDDFVEGLAFQLAPTFGIACDSCFLRGSRGPEVFG